MPRIKWVGAREAFGSGGCVSPLGAAPLAVRGGKGVAASCCQPGCARGAPCGVQDGLLGPLSLRDMSFQPWGTAPEVEPKCRELVGREVEGEGSMAAQRPRGPHL